MSSIAPLGSLVSHFRLLAAAKGDPGQSDFSALGGALGGARVVMLGEQSHGDGAAFVFKARLVEYLHLHHGFDVLAFEADFFSLARAWANAGEPGDIARQVARNVYSFWRDSTQMQPLWSFIRDRFGTGRPLVVAGIDPRHTGPCAAESLVTELEGYLAGVRPGLTASEGFASFRGLLASLIGEEYAQKVSARERALFFGRLLELRDALAGEAGAEASFWRQELRNLAYTARNGWGFEGRDEGMGQNLLWLAQERYPEEKIIVWAHNYHLVKCKEAVAAADPQVARELAMFHDTSLGEVAARALGDDVYVLGLISGQGAYDPLAYRGGTEASSRIQTPPEGSLESHLLAAEHDVAFLDFRQIPARDAGPFLMSGVEHDKFLELDWARVYDGVLYLREMSGLSFA